MSQQRPLPAFIPPRGSEPSTMATVHPQTIIPQQSPGPISSSLPAPPPLPSAQNENIRPGYENAFNQQMTALPPYLHPVQEPYYASNNQPFAQQYNSWGITMHDRAHWVREQQVRQMPRYMPPQFPYYDQNHVVRYTPQGRQMPNFPPPPSSYYEPKCMPEYVPQPPPQGLGVQFGPASHAYYGQENNIHDPLQPPPQDFRFQLSWVSNFHPDIIMSTHGQQHPQIQRAFSAPPINWYLSENMIPSTISQRSLCNLAVRTSDPPPPPPCPPSPGFSSSNHNTNLELLKSTMDPPILRTENWERSGEGDLKQVGEKPHWCTNKLLLIPAERYYEAVRKTVRERPDIYGLVERYRVVGGKVVKDVGVGDVDGREVMENIEMDGMEEEAQEVEIPENKNMEDKDRVEEQLSRECKEESSGVENEGMEETDEEMTDDEMLPEGNDNHASFSGFSWNLVWFLRVGI